MHTLPRGQHLWRFELSLADDRPVWASGLVKSFGKFEAVKGVSLSVPKGAIYGVLGPNGAGKTTTLRAICGMVKSGRTRANGASLGSRARAM